MLLAETALVLDQTKNELNEYILAGIRLSKSP